jgi:aspartokinase-like uncharacterized kinase
MGENAAMKSIFGLEGKRIVVIGGGTFAGLVRSALPRE